MLLDKLRDASNSLVWKIFLAVIAISFALGGVATYMVAQTDTSAVKVNGEEIPQHLFQQQYDNEYKRLSEQLGAQFSAVADTPEFINSLRSEVLNRLINQELLRQYSDQLKLSVSDERIKQEIVTSPMFQVDGKFDNAAYQRLLRQNNMSADAYAEYLREGLRLEQLQTGLAETEFLLPVQQDEFVKHLFQQRKVRLANLPLTDEIAKQSISDQEVQDYYNANKAKFLMPETVKVQYLNLNADKIAESVKVTDIEIAQYYQDNKAQFVSQGQQRLAHIQFSAETEALDAYQALQGGADFAELAKTKSVDKLSAQKGGDLGWVNAGDLPSAFENAAIALEVGQYSQPVKVDNAYHIVKVEERKGSEPQPLEQVKARIARQIRQELINTRFYDIEKKMNEKAFEDQSSLKAAAEVAGIEIQETDYFARNGVPAELNFPQVISKIFDSDVSQGGVNSDAMNVGELHSVIVRVVEHKPEGTRSLDEAKAEIVNDLKRQKAEKIVLAKAEEIIKSLTNGGNLPEGVSFGQAQTWVYAENKDPQLNTIIFAMPKPTETPSYKVSNAENGDVVIIALDAVEDGNVNEQERLQADLQIIQAQRLDTVNHLLKSLRARASIEVNEAFINQQN